MDRRVLLDMLTPSSNTVLEPVTTAMLAGLPEASAHFGRFKVTEIALTREALGQFDDREILGAAELLSHAKVGVVADLGILILDRMATVVWKSLCLVGADPRRVRGWGRLFEAAGT
jgi:hypothetical protein